MSNFKNSTIRPKLALLLLFAQKEHALVPSILYKDKLTKIVLISKKFDAVDKIIEILELNNGKISNQKTFEVNGEVN